MLESRLGELRALLERADQTTLQEGLGLLVERLVHDLKSPLGTFALEAESLGLVADDVVGALDRNDVRQAKLHVAEVREIGSNLEAATRRVERLCEVLSDFRQLADASERSTS